MKVKDVESGYFGVAAHGALAVASVCEGLAFKSRTAKLLAGCVFGWHAYATFYHLRERQLERERQAEKQSCKEKA